MTGRDGGRLLRTIPGDSLIHRMWSGTKLVAMVGLMLPLFLRPTWSAQVAVAALLIVAFGVARLPLGALPRPSRWFCLAALGLAAAAWAAGGAGSLASAARLLMLIVVTLGGAAIVGWTTRLADVAPALGRLGRPLRAFRLPVDEWVVTLSMGIRSLPLIADEMRVLRAAHRLRSRGGRVSLRTRFRQAADQLTAALDVATRRAGELAQAMEARGGMRSIGEPDSRGPGRIDAVALAVVATTIVVAMTM